MTASDNRGVPRRGFRPFSTRLALALGLLSGGARAAEPPAQSVRDGSLAPECPPGWYCEHEVEPKVEARGPPAPPKSRYPLHALVGRVAWAPFPHEASERAVMLGAGLGFRRRPARSLAYEAGFIGFGGRDFLGRSRYELGSEVNLVLLGGAHRAPGPFVLLGPDLAFARVEGVAPTLVLLGGHVGFGGEWPVGQSSHLLFELDVFARGRVDAAASRVPEYRDPLTGAASDVSTGAVLRFGLVTEL